MILGFGQKNKTVYACGGSVINKYYILTGAHCLYNFNKPKPEVRIPTEIVLAENNIDVDPECFNNSDDYYDYDESCKSYPAIRMKVEKVFIHEDYDINNEGGKSPNDIALIRLKNSITLHSEDPDSSIIIPVCLPWNKNDPGQILFSGSKFTLTGWGSTTNNRVKNVLSVQGLDLVHPCIIQKTEMYI